MKLSFCNFVLPSIILMFGFSSAAAAVPLECGEASWYAIRAQTASGEMMNPDAMTAAHPSLPFGSQLRVVNQINGREVTVRINDRGPFVKKRIIDVSRAAAEQLGFRRAGHVKVCIDKL